MGIRSFFKRPTLDDVAGSRFESAMLMDMGRERVKRRSEKWYQFFSWMMLIGNIVFYLEGRKERKELEKKGKPFPKISIKKNKRKRDKKKISGKG